MYVERTQHYSSKLNTTLHGPGPVVYRRLLTLVKAPEDSQVSQVNSGVHFMADSAVLRASHSAEPPSPRWRRPCRASGPPAIPRSRARPSRSPRAAVAHPTGARKAFEEKPPRAGVAQHSTGNRERLYCAAGTFWQFVEHLRSERPYFFFSSRKDPIARQRHR